MNPDALDHLAKNALAFARAYTEVKEALVKAGVPEKEAIETARASAYMAALADASPNPGEPWER